MFSIFNPCRLRVFLCSETQVRNVYLQNFLLFKHKLLSICSTQVDLRKRFPMYHISSMGQAASKNRGYALLDSEHSWDDWEREITQNCLPSQDHRSPWNRSEKIHFALSFLDLNRKLQNDILCLVEKVHLLSTLELFELLYSKTCSSLSLPEDLSYEFLEELSLSPPILQKSQSFSFLEWSDD